MVESHSPSIACAIGWFRGGTPPIQNPLRNAVFQSKAWKSMKHPTPSDFIVKVEESHVSVIFKPSNSDYYFGRLADPEDIPATIHRKKSLRWRAPSLSRRSQTRNCPRDAAPCGVRYPLVSEQPVCTGVSYIGV